MEQFENGEGNKCYYFSMKNITEYILESRNGDILRDFWKDINWNNKQVRKDLDSIGIGDALYKEKDELIYFEDSSKLVRSNREYWVENLPQSFMDLYHSYVKRVEKEGKGEMWMDAHGNTGYCITIGIDE